MRSILRLSSWGLPLLLLLLLSSSVQAAPNKKLRFKENGELRIIFFTDPVSCIRVAAHALESRPRRPLTAPPPNPHRACSTPARVQRRCGGRAHAALVVPLQSLCRRRRRRDQYRRHPSLTHPSCPWPCTLLQDKKTAEASAVRAGRCQHRYQSLQRLLHAACCTWRLAAHARRPPHVLPAPPRPHSPPSRPPAADAQHPQGRARRRLCFLLR